MLKEYDFFDGGKIEFDDNKSVRELINAAFREFDYYEPLGMDIVTVYQCHHSKTNNGWFTTDTEKRCCEEIENCNELCFAYYMPEVFYFAEGGWGHHMKELGNHPAILSSVNLHLRFDNFNNTVVINGTYCFLDIIRLLKKADYISISCNKMKIIPIGVTEKFFYIMFDDEITKRPLAEFKNLIKEQINNKLSNGEFFYHEVIELL